MRSPTLARAAVIAILAISGAVGAFATIAPGPDGQALPPTTALVETLSIRASDALLPSPASYFREEPFQRGDTLASFLSRLGIEEAQVARLVRRRHRLPPRPAQGRPLHGGVRGASPRRAAGAPRARARRRVREPGQDLSRGSLQRRLLRAGRQESAQGVPALAAGVLPRELGFRHAHASLCAVLARAPRHRLRRAGGHARARGGRWRGRVRRSERRIRQRSVSPPSRPICHDLCAPEPYRRRRAPRRKGSAERYYRLCRPDRMGHWPAP